jgi:endonuclease/exonuclease/phosphatase (EEP) superfamily protein YafD
MTRVPRLKAIFFSAVVLGLGLSCLIGCGPAPAGQRLSVMTCNLGNSGGPIPTTKQISALIQAAEPPDVLLLQDAPWPVKFEDLARVLGYPHVLSGRSLKPPCHLAILSRRPLGRVEMLTFPSERQRPGAVCATMRVEDQEVRVCTVHLPSLSWLLLQDGSRRNIESILFRELFGETPRTQAIDDLLEWLNIHRFDLTIVGGDFNTFFPSQGIRAMDRRYDDALWPSWDFFQGTYVKLDFPLKPRIDFLFHTGNIKVREARVIRRTAGDHYPVRAVFILPTEASSRKGRAGRE